MDELSIQELIRIKYSGGTLEASVWFNLAIQTALVLFAGIVLWRVSSLIHRKRQIQRNDKRKFETPYSKSWKRK